MPTECSPDFFGFEPVEGRAVVAAFDAGAVTWRRSSGAVIKSRPGGCTSFKRSLSCPAGADQNPKAILGPCKTQASLE
jgi:hypothetical protein